MKLEDSYEVVDPINAMPGALDIAKLLSYGTLLMRVVGALEAAQKGPVGTEAPLPTVEVKRGGKAWDWEMGTLTRKK